MSRPATTSRRDFLRASMLTSAVFGTGSALHAEDKTRKASENKGVPRNVIFMVSDGMNHGALSLANEFRALTTGERTNWLKLYRERAAVRCLAETFSASSVVTDSAAAASAWGCGQRVNNGTINVSPDKEAKPLATLHSKMQAIGKRFGLVSTATITHATPAGFAANVDNRGDEEKIAKQYFDRKVDVILGGGQKFFSTELRQKFIAAGYDFTDTRDNLKSLPHNKFKPLLGLFSDSYIPFSIDRENVPDIEAKIPTLSEMAQTALDRLNDSTNGFFLMIEGARIDHAGHANDAATSIHEQLAFDDAIGTVLAFIEKNPDTLLVITTDHGCGGIQMNGVSADANMGFLPGLYNASTPSFLKLKNFKRSFEWMKQNKIDALSGPKLTEALKGYTGLELSERQTKDAQGLKLTAARAFMEHTGVGWTSGNHTGDLVEFCAAGPGSHLFSPFIWNYEVHGTILKALEIA